MRPDAAAGNITTLVLTDTSTFGNDPNVAAMMTKLATLPSKEEIFSKLLYVINAPAQQLVTAMNGVGRNLAVVVDQGVKENKFQG